MAQTPGDSQPVSALQNLDARAFRLDVQGLRGVAVLLVVLFHAEVRGFSGGFVGVDVFFVISGFVIGQLLLHELEATGRIDLKRFFLRRARRLMPAMALMLAVVALLSTVLISTFGQQRAARTGASASLIVANLYLSLFGDGDGYFGAGDDLNPFLHTWSLSVEEQFYLALPLLMAMAWRLGTARGRARASTLATLASVFAVSFVGAVALTVNGANDESVRWAFYLSPLRAWEFIAGILIAAWRRPSFGRLSPIVPLGGALLIAAAALGFSPGTRFPGLAALLPVAGAGLMLAGTSPAVRSVLSFRPLAWIGDVSYSFYLWHWPFIVFARAWWPSEARVLPAAAALSLIPAVASYRWLEQPIRSAQAPARRTLRLAAVSVMVPFLCLFGLVEAHARLTRTPNVASLEASQRLPSIFQLGCGDALLSELPPQCSSSAGIDAPTALLIGDSNAAQWADVVTAVAAEAGYSLDVVVRSACPMATVSLERRGRLYGECRVFVDDALEVLGSSERRYDLVIMASASDQYLFSEVVVPVTSMGQPAAVVDRREIYAEGMRQFLEQIGSPGQDVVVVHPIPKTGIDSRWSLSDCPFVRVWADPIGCAGSFSEDHRQVQAAAASAEREALGSFPSVRFIDPAPIVCPEDCVTYREGRWYYRDNGHLTLVGAELARQQFEDVFRRDRN